AVATATAAGGTALTGLTAPSGRARASPTLAAPAAGATPPTLAAPAAGATFAVGGIGLARLMRRRALPGSQLRQHRAGGDHGGVVLGSDTGLAHQVVHIALLVRGLHRDHGAGLPGAGGAPGAVQVGLVLDRRIGVDHQRDLVDVDATGGDVGAHQGRVAPGAEGLEVAGAGTLREVAVQVHGRHAAGGELAGQVLRAVLGAGEHDRAARRGGQVLEHVEAGCALDLEHMVLHGADRAGRRIGRVGDGGAQEAIDQLLHA